ncbi:MAG: hypothetical protein AAGH65_08545 [Pseudomonadota bacterium]
MKQMKCLLLIVPLALMLGCTEPVDPTEVVSERSKARWDALIERDFVAARQFYTPGFREITPEFDFRVDMDRRPVRWESAEVNDVACEEGRCTVEVLIGYRIPSAPGQINNLGNRRPITEDWVEIDGEWWFVHE